MHISNFQNILIVFQYLVLPLQSYTFYTFKNIFLGAWVAQSVKYATVDFGSGHDLTVLEMELCWALR